MPIYDKLYYGKYRIPEYMQEHVKGYVEQHIPVGSFLEAVISNNLFEAVGHADKDNLANLPAYVMFFYNEVPSTCWGSFSKYKNWINVE